MDTTMVPFRLLEMDCCRFRLLWIEAELPAFCPMCGHHWARQEPRPPRALTEDLAATLTYTDE